MIKRTIYILFFIIIAKFNAAQDRYIDSLQNELKSAQDDTLRLRQLILLTEVYGESIPDSSFFFSEQLLSVSRKLKFRLNEVHALSKMGYALLNMGNYPRSLQIFLTGITIAEDPQSEKNIAPDKYSNTEQFHFQPMTPHMQRLDQLSELHMQMGILYFHSYDYKKVLFHFFEARQLAEQTGNVSLLCTINLELGRFYLSKKKLDSALIAEKKAYDQSIRSGFIKYQGSILLNLGRIYSAMGNNQEAIEYLRRAIIASWEQNYIRGVVATNLLFSELYRQDSNSDSSLYYARAALEISLRMNVPDLSLRSYVALAAYYRSVYNNDSAAKYQAFIIKMNDSLFNSKQVQDFQNIDFDDQRRQQEMESAKKAYRNQAELFGLLVGLVMVLLIAIILLRNNRHKQRAFAILQKLKQETDRQKTQVEQTLTELKSTQAQLIQAEKMASLGELTTGIAHEIQNPLNFVNNFSEVNKELIEELKAEAAAGNNVGVITIANDISENEDKISHHGKRADAIVKGMLQHSRSSAGQKEPTDINALADEYLRLAYHGLRAKDKDFNSNIETDFDEGLGQINIIPQDIGRVLLNLYNNAFYAVYEKKKLYPEGFESSVSVSTKKVGNKVEIRIKDNGNGIPQKVIDKIFQPFFTTKPPGQGTGLGLSLSYDIVKAHDGEIKVNTKEGVFTEFNIILPS
jgi:signal transduction histidine kinase